MSKTKGNFICQEEMEQDLLAVVIVVVARAKEMRERLKAGERRPLKAVFARTAGKRLPISQGSHAIRFSARTAKLRWLPSVDLRANGRRSERRDRHV
jgi:hypothetical protein